MERLFHLVKHDKHRNKEEPPVASLFGSSNLTQKSIDFLSYCIDFLLQYGTSEQGIFRIPGEGELIKKLKEMVNKEASSPDCDFNRLAFKKSQVSEVASLFKLFFREMPDPLLQHELYDCFISVYGMAPEHRSQVLQRVIRLLEPERFKILEILLIFLREMAMHADKTLMSAHNLAIVFAPNILRSGSENPGLVITDAKASLEIVNLLITEPSLMDLDVQEKENVEDPSASDKFRKTMQANYQAIRRDSSFKLEQVSRKSRISQSEFMKKMEFLSQKFLEGELDPAMFDDAAEKFMDPSLIAQFAGQESSFVSTRAARQQRQLQFRRDNNYEEDLSMLTVDEPPMSPRSSAARQEQIEFQRNRSGHLNLGRHRPIIERKASPPDTTASPSASKSSEPDPAFTGGKEEELDDIMGDLLGPFQPKEIGPSQTLSTAPLEQANEEEAILTLGLLELILAPSHALPEIVVPYIEQVDEVQEEMEMPEVEVETESNPLPTTGLFTLAESGSSKPDNDSPLSGV